MKKTAGAGSAAIDGLVVVAVPPLVIGPDQYLARSRQSFRLVEQLLQPCERVGALWRQIVDRIVESDDLAGQQLAVAFQRLGDAARVIDRLDDDAGRLLRT